MIHRILIAVCIALLAAPVFADDRDDGKDVFSGTVTDNAGNPVAGANVQAYSMRFEKQGIGIVVTPIGNVTTKEDGAFSFTADLQSGIREIAMIVAHKEGLSVGWSNYYAGGGEIPNLDIQLGPPHNMTGVVMDEDGRPVPNAEVRAMLIADLSGRRPSILYSMEPCERGVATTDEQGRFSLNDIPKGASAEFTVQAQGYARVATYAPSTQPGQFKANQSDIKIEMPREAIIQGKVVDTKTRKPVPAAQLVLRLEPSNPFMRHVVTSDAEGRFCADGLAPGRYLMKLIADNGKAPGMVAKSVSVNIGAGELKKDIVVEASQGLPLEVIVLEKGTKAPIENAHVSLRSPENREDWQAQTDEKGIARFSLAAGEYETTYVYHPDYATDQRGERVTLAEDKPSSVTLTLKAKAKIRGTALDPSGDPVAGAVVRLIPLQGDQGMTNASGEFEVPWQPQPWMKDRGTVPVIVIRDMERHLATAAEIEDASKPINLTLEPAVSIAGKVVDPEGNPLPDASISAFMNLETMSSSIGPDRAVSDEEGSYEITTLPLDRTYDLMANAAGYGAGQCKVYAASSAGQRIEAETITLQLANLTLSGKVVDMEDKPVANARVYAYGSGQPHCEATTDKDGKFTLKGLCKGELRLQASIREGGTYRSGSATVQSGDTDVVVVLGEQASASPARPAPPRSLVGEALPEVAGFGGDVADVSLEGKRILACFWNMNQRPSRHALRVLASKADLLEKEGVTVLAIHAESADMAKLKEWSEQYKVPFTLGVIEKDRDVTRKAWGAQGLPWLILADTEHKVVKEGFSADNLEAALAESGTGSTQ